MNKKAGQRVSSWPITLTIILAAEVFVADLLLPLGLAAWLPYAAIVLIALWVPYRNFALFAAVGTTALTLIAGFLSPVHAAGLALPQTLYNRALGVLVIWVTALLCLQRKRAEVTLREGEARYRDLFENANDVLYTHDLAGNFTSLNPAGEAITGYTRDEALTMNVAQVVAPEHVEMARQMIAGKVPGESPTRYELDIIAKDGRRVAVEVNASPIYRAGRPVGVQGIARDVTERHQLEAQLRRAQRLEALGRLAGGIAHDFNNLLNGIIGFSELTLRELPEGSREREYLGRVPGLGHQAAHLIKQLLSFAGRAPLERNPLDLTMVLKETGDLLGRTLPATITVEVESPREPLLVEADPTQIQQIVLNLATNGHDAMPQGGTLAIRVKPVTLTAEEMGRHTERRPGAFACLTVADTGTGIPISIRDRIFDPFFTTKEPGQGTGLGLASVHGAVHQHDGWIELETAEGQGTAVHVFLPLLLPLPRQTEAGLGSAAALPRGTESLLLVEDNPVVRELGEVLLSQLGYTVYTAADGVEALAIFRANPHVALLFTDAIMPRMGASDLVPAVRAVDPTVKVLVATGYAPEAVRASLRHLEINGFLQKPFQQADLATAVRAALDGHAPGKQ